jgi:hypothetical protein
MAFFQSLYNCLVRGAHAVLQFYPEVLGNITGIRSEMIAR